MEWVSTINMSKRNLIFNIYDTVVNAENRISFQIQIKNKLYYHGDAK